MNLCGGEGNDTIYGDGAEWRFSVDATGWTRLDEWCSEVDDLLYGNDRQDSSTAMPGSDTIYGGKDSDLLNGGAGDDWLFGGLGKDNFIGGMGGDGFGLSADRGTDSVINFEVGVDKFVLMNGLSFQQLQVSATPNGTLLGIAGPMGF